MGDLRVASGVGQPIRRSVQLEPSGGAEYVRRIRRTCLDFFDQSNLLVKYPLPLERMIGKSGWSLKAC
jgi:hypothetical protein